jgi:hypothetical protein
MCQNGSLNVSFYLNAHSLFNWKPDKNLVFRSAIHFFPPDLRLDFKIRTQIKILSLKQI